MIKARKTITPQCHRLPMDLSLKRSLVGVLLLLVFSMVASTANAGESFYWKDSYGRGAGVPTHLVCQDSSQEYDAGLCYKPCKSGYTGVAEYCWKNGVPWYDFDDYFRGYGNDKTESTCGKGQVYDAGLCYTACRSGYQAEGPVCWGKAPPGYIDCGAGFAKSKLTCATTMGGQIVAAANLATYGMGKIADAAEALQKASKAAGGDAEEASQIEKVFLAVQKLGRDIAKTIKESKPARALAAVDEKITQKLGGPENRAMAERAWKLLKGGTSAAYKAQSAAFVPIDIARMVFSVAALGDPTPVSGFLAAYLYPVYKGGTPQGAPILSPGPAATTNTPGVPPDRIFAVMNNSTLRAYAVEQSGAIQSPGQIGNGWGGMREITAGPRGYIYALQGTTTRRGNRVFKSEAHLLIYQLDNAYHWTKTAVNGGYYYPIPVARAIFVAGIRNRGKDVYLYVLTQNGHLMLEKLHHEAVPGVRSGEYTPRDQKWEPGVWDKYRRIFVGPNGAVFVIKPNGRMYVYSPNKAGGLSQFQRPPQYVGPGWNRYTKVFCGASGTIYAIAKNGDLDMFSKESYGWFGPKKIGNGWGAVRLITAALN